MSDNEDATISDETKDTFSRLEKQLHNQLEKCKNWRFVATIWFTKMIIFAFFIFFLQLTNSLHSKALGDVAGTNRFENLAISVQRDMDIIKLAHRNGGKIPKFHFEQKSFNIVKCNTDLAETELEIQVIRGISYNVSKPKDVDTYVKVEFLYPPVLYLDLFFIIHHIHEYYFMFSGNTIS